MGIQRLTGALKNEPWATVDRGERWQYRIPQRYIHIARALDKRIKSAQAHFVGGHHA